ncbi:MAG: type II secretion system F family protein [Planctomycetes bacterium]|nr:type II secretion system F family protein [Planctomycetota bacterium]
MIFILGWIGKTRAGGQVTDVLGFGLTGTSGAVIWLSMVFGSLLLLFVIYQIVAKGFRGKRFLDAFFLGIPIVGKCLRSFAIARFSWAFHLTQQTGMPIDQSLHASLRATNNGAFQDAAGLISRKVHAGSTLSEALAASGLFPLDFLSMVEVAETSGTVPEALHRLSPQFEEEARRSLSAMTTALGWLIWGIVAAFIIFLIFRIVLSYVDMITKASKEAG